VSGEVSNIGSGLRGDAVWNGPPVKVRENPERMAWVVLLACFGVFVVLLITVPLTLRYLVQHATSPQTATLDPTQGTVLLYQPGATEPIAITELRKDVVEGSTIQAGDGPTQASLRLISESVADEALGSVQIYTGSRLQINRMRSPMFEMSSEPYQVQLNLAQGQARVFTNSGRQRPLSVEIMTPHGSIMLDAGSFQIAVTENQTDITVSSGSATLVKEGSPDLAVTEGLRAWMTTAAIADASVPAAQNLLRNGNFSEPMRDSWESYVIAQNVTPGKVNIMERDGRRVAYFVRQGEDNVPTEVGIRQVIDRDINVYDKLYLTLDAKLLFQSLPGAGYLSSEYPLRVEITYTDIYGKSGLTWGHGFYFRDPENENWQIVGGEQIPPFNWYTYRSPNLMELLKDTRPARIDGIRIYASGWNYQSMVSEVYLVAE
jgi:hypothetical protein